ncbi:LysR family transcriptional regulator [Agrobacterium vaccinii]|uniref:LysR family transcriptional regulator n=1 Tax=Agrobacterium vaccinii TaxID=2735528 RepID=UPI000DD0334B|nr:LysR family transcriptional regulator [Agrobacterium vaccinii]UHS57606.1 LysR family transcriptional regulator [Agrobacterium vaccinii]UHS62382.1 LysR family transcriptional regulator [Agrobacterium vaccinii]
MDTRRRLVPDIVTLQAFECAARHGNFTRAAEELNLTQSAVSRQISDLEAQTGMLLFERIRRRVVLSEAGRKFLPDVQRLLHQSEQLMVRAVTAGASSTSLSIATLPTFGSRWLTPRLHKFMASRPETVLTVGSRSQPFDFDEEGFDIAIHYGQPVWAHGTCTFLCNEVIVPVASPALLAMRAVEHQADMLDGPLLHVSTRPKLWTEWFEMNGLASDQAYRGSRFDQFSMLIEAAISGLGFALLPRYLIETELKSGLLQVIFDVPLQTENSYYIALPEGRQDNALARAFQNWLLEQVGTPL